MSEKDEKKIVWIACRAKQGCPGNHAELIASRSLTQAASGAFEPVQGGRFTRYRCQTCMGNFAIST